MKRIHIVGASPRTGTTLLAEAMVACFEIDGFEPHEAPLSSDRPGAAVYLTKTPRDILVAGPRLAGDPDLTVLCMIRDPRDVITSKHGRDPVRYWSPLRTWHVYISEVRKLEDHPRFLLVRYEDLVRRPDAVQDLISTRLPFLRRRAPFSAFHHLAAPSAEALLALGGLRPIDDGRVGRWRQHLPRVAGQLAQHGPLTADLIEFGYEPDPSWLSCLDGVVPDLTPSHFPEQATGDMSAPARNPVGHQTKV